MLSFELGNDTFCEAAHAEEEDDDDFMEDPDTYSR